MTLVIGNPSDGLSKKSATFTRFVLPFAYHLQETNDTNDSKLYFEEDTDVLRQKRMKKYFSREASHILYEKAKMHTMCKAWAQTKWASSEQGKGIKVLLTDDKEFKIKMLPPQLMLFEVDDYKQKEHADIIQTGFILTDIYFPDTEEDSEQKNTPTLDDLLMLNENLRFFGTPTEGHAKNLSRRYKDIPVDYFIGDAETEPLEEAHINDRYFLKWSNLLEKPIKTEEGFLKIFPAEWSEKGKLWSKDELKFPEHSSFTKHWQVYDDNRTFVYTAAVLRDGLNPLKKDDAQTGLNEDQLGAWVKLLNVDMPEKNYKLTQFEKAWADERTYKRWEELGSLYGYSYHSATAILTSDNGHLARVFRWQYSDMAILLFYIRISLFRFSLKLSEILEKKSSGAFAKNDASILNELKALRSQFSYFTILYRMPLISNQQQMIEMYHYNRKYFEIEELYKEVKLEIDETHGLMEQTHSKKMSSIANLIAVLGVSFAVSSLLANYDLITTFKPFCKVAAIEPICDWAVEQGYVHNVKGVLNIINLAISGLVGYLVYKRVKKNG